MVHGDHTHAVFATTVANKVLVALVGLRIGLVRASGIAEGLGALIATTGGWGAVSGAIIEAVQLVIVES